MIFETIEIRLLLIVSQYTVNVKHAELCDRVYIITLPNDHKRRYTSDCDNLNEIVFFFLFFTYLFYSQK